jgi:tetratricopeptide (TPR) repeat protein
MTAQAISARIESAVHLLNARRFDDARQLYDEILAAEPTHPLALAGIGHIAYLNNQLQQGFDFFASAAAAHPDHPIILAGLAQGHGLLGRGKEAVICLERAIELAPRDARYRANLADALTRLSLIDQAIVQYQAAIDLDPRNAVTHLGLGIALFGRNKMLAEQHLRHAVALGPGLPEASHSLALLLTERSEYGEALRHAETAYLAEPGRASFMVTYARLLTETGCPEEARRMVQRCLALAPYDIDALEASARLSLLDGEGDGALRPLASAVRRSPGNAEGLIALARTFAAAGRLNDALKCAEEALALSAGHPEATAIRRRLLLATGRFTEAETGAQTVEADLVYVADNMDAGEALLFSRFLLSSAGSTPPLLLCDRMVGILLAHVEGLEVYATAEPPPAAVSLVAHASLARLDPTHFSGQMPYLTPHPDNTAAWTEAFSLYPAPRIGLTWSARPEAASLGDLVEATPVDATLVSLAQGLRRHDLRDWPRIVDAGCRLDTHADLVAAVASLDAVIACNSLAAHVAGALGKPGVVLVPENLPWCWAHENGRSLWYPSLQVFPIPVARKDRPEALDRLAERVAAMLAVSAERRLPRPATQAIAL